MTKFGVILFVVYLKTNVITVSSWAIDTAMFYQTNDKIIKTIDDLFFSLKVSKHFTNSKRAEEYMSRQKLVQDAICNNHKIYKKVRDISKTKISNKIAYFISNINQAIEGLIRSEAVRNNYHLRNDVNISTLEDESVKHFVTLASRFNLKLKALASTITVNKLKRSKNNSQEEVRRIFAGSSTGIARYPFMVSVHVAGRFVCAGSLLHESLALSAASCLMSSVDTKPHIQIRVASDYVSKMGSLVNIEQLIFHPEFNRASLANNLVLLQTKKVLRFRKQLVVAIQYDRDATSVLRTDVEDLVILGWGQRRMDRVREEDRPLSEGHLQVYDFNACQYIYTRDFVTDKSFCAGFVDRGAGACNHDAGGPALVNNVLVGVISFGPSRCGAADAPTVFSRLGLYAEWIDGVFRKFEESQINKTEEQINISENILREEVTDLDQAMKDIYKENFNVDEVLYGPIETLYGDETTNASTKLILREYPTDPNMFPNPDLVANIASPKTPKPIEPPEGYWKDSSIEQTPTEDHKLPANQFGNIDTISLLYSNLYSTTEKTDIYNLQDIYADSEENVTSTLATKMTEEALYVNDNNEIYVNPQIYDPKNNIYEDGGTEEPKRTYEGSKLRKKLNNAVISTSDSRYTRLSKISSRHSMTYKPDKLKQSSKAKIENAEVNEEAIIVMSDSGTTQMIEVDKKNPLYQQGFKMLADKILRKKVQI